MDALYLIAISLKNGCERIIVYSNNADIIALMLLYMTEFFYVRCKGAMVEIWNRNQTKVSALAHSCYEFRRNEI